MQSRGTTDMITTLARQRAGAAGSPSKGAGDK